MLDRHAARRVHFVPGCDSAGCSRPATTMAPGFGRMGCKAVAGIALGLLMVAATSLAQSLPPRAVTAVRLQGDERLVVDGRLSEEVWRRAEPAADFRQEDPLNGEPATEATEVRVVFDGRRIVF